MRNVSVSLLIINQIPVRNSSTITNWQSSLGSFTQIRRRFQLTKMVTIRNTRWLHTCWMLSVITMRLWGSRFFEPRKTKKSSVKWHIYLLKTSCRFVYTLLNTTVDGFHAWRWTGFQNYFPFIYFTHSIHTIIPVIKGLRYSRYSLTSLPPLLPN